LKTPLLKDVVTGGRGRVLTVDRDPLSQRIAAAVVVLDYGDETLLQRV
jgi:hypothetical protein